MNSQSSTFRKSWPRYSRVRSPALHALILSAISLPASASPQTTPSQVAEGTMSAVPIDFEFNAAGTRVAVRGVDLTSSYSSAGVITLWKPEDGTMTHTVGVLGFCNSAQPARAPEFFSSDTVRVNANIAVMIADDENRTRTLIDVVDIGTSPACLANFSRPSSITQPWHAAGQAHDVEVTPDGKFAVVNCRNWIFILDLSASPPTVVVQYNTADPATIPSWAITSSGGGETEFWTAVDSIALTDNRGIVVQGAWMDSDPRFFPIVYLIDFIGSDPPGITQIDMKPFLEEEGDNFDPHDVAIVPVGDLAVATFDNAVSLFDLATLTHTTSLFAPVARRYPLQVDSVEVTDTHAVVIGGLNPTSIKVFDLRAGSGGTPGLNETYDASLSDLRGAHDLALLERLNSSQPEVAVIKSGRNVVGDPGEVYMLRDFTGASASPSLDTVGSHGNPRFSSSGIPRVSDSVVTASFRVGNVMKRYGVSIGIESSTSTTTKAWIDAVDVDVISAPYTTYAWDIGSSSYHTIPTDLAFSVGAKRTFVRCQAPPDESPIATSGRDVLVVAMDGSPSQTPILEVGSSPQIGGRGVMDERNQADTMLINRRKAVSISENLSDTSNPAGYVHTVENN